AVADASLAGLYHAAAGGQVSWYGYARFVIQYATDHGTAVRVQAADIGAVTSDQFPTTARRPLNSRLNTSKLRQAFGLQLPDWQAGVIQMLEKIGTGERHDNT